MMKALSAALLLSGVLLSAVAMADPAGQELFLQNCAKCHGEDGTANTSRGHFTFARNFTDAKWQASVSDNHIYDTITNSPGWYTPMPAFKGILSEEQRRDLVKVVRGFNPKASADK